MNYYSILYIYKHIYFMFKVKKKKNDDCISALLSKIVMKILTLSFRNMIFQSAFILLLQSTDMYLINSLFSNYIKQVNMFY